MRADEARQHRRATALQVLRGPDRAERFGKEEDRLSQRSAAQYLARFLTSPTLSGLHDQYGVSGLCSRVAELESSSGIVQSAISKLIPGSLAYREDNVRYVLERGAEDGKDAWPGGGVHIEHRFGYLKPADPCDLFTRRQRRDDRHVIENLVVRSGKTRST